MSDHGVSLSFVRPYSLPGSVITYYECIVKHSVVNCPSQELRLNLTDTQFDFAFSDYNITSRCEDQYIEFNVAAYNPAGMGTYASKDCYHPRGSIVCSAWKPGKMFSVWLRWVGTCLSDKYVVYFTSVCINSGVKKFPHMQISSQCMCSYWQQQQVV